MADSQWTSEPLSMYLFKIQTTRHNGTNDSYKQTASEIFTFLRVANSLAPYHISDAPNRVANGEKIQQFAKILRCLNIRIRSGDPRDARRGHETCESGFSPCAVQRGALASVSNYANSRGANAGYLRDRIDPVMSTAP